MSKPDNKNDLTPLEVVSILGNFFLSWKSCKPTTVSVKKLSGGYLNTIYAVSTTETLAPRPDGQETPQKLVVRKAGQGVLDRSLLGLGDDNHRDIISKSSGTNEIIVAAGLSDKGLGPTLYGVFDGTRGRVEELLQGHTLTMEDIKDEKSGIERALAEGYARFHIMELPLPLLTSEDGRLMSHLNFAPISKENEAKLKSMGIETFLFNTVDWDTELKWTEDNLRKLKSPIVVTHYDANFLNIWVRDEPVKVFDNLESLVVFLDFELVRNIYRAVEFGGHFIHRMIKADGINGKSSGHPFPTMEERRSFLEMYQKELERLSKTNERLKDFDPKGRDSVNNLVKESQYGCIYYCGFLISALAAIMDNAMSVDPTIFDAVYIIHEVYLAMKKEIEEMEKKGSEDMI